METTSTAKRVTALAALVLVAAASLTGCDPTPEPDPTPTVSETTDPATPEPEETVAAPVPTTITVSATSLSVLDETSSVIVDIPFTTNGDTAASMLSEALGTAPTTSVTTGSNCRRAGTIYDFGGLELDGAGEITMVPPAVFTIRVNAAATAGGLAITGPSGVHVGQSVADVVAAIPSSDDISTNPLVLEHLGGSGPDVNGVSGWAEGSALAHMFAPVYIFGDC